MVSDRNKFGEPPEIAQRIRQLRESRGEKQTAFAAALGLKYPSMVSKWESGTRPHPDQLARLASIAEGEAKRYFLAQAGIDMDETGKIEVRRPETGLNVKLLTLIVEVIEGELRGRRQRPPARAYAELVSDIYDFCHSSGVADQSTVEALFASARKAIHLLGPGTNSDRGEKVATPQEDRGHHERFGTRRK